MIAAANRIARSPYVYGGGHNARFKGPGYDCSGSVSFALRGGRLLRSPLASGGLMGWGRPGRGRWITVYAHGGHTYMVVAGLRFDTSGRNARGTRWTRGGRGERGYVARHARARPDRLAPSGHPVGLARRGGR